MDFLNTFWNSVIAHFDPVSVLLVLLGGYFSKRYLAEINLSNTIKTLLVGTVFMAVYIIILHVSGLLNKVDYLKYFLSYTVATSLYEIFAKEFGKIIRKKD